MVIPIPRIIKITCILFTEKKSTYSVLQKYTVLMDKRLSEPLYFLFHYFPFPCTNLFIKTEKFTQCTKGT